jgi:hypothetical protein
MTPLDTFFVLVLLPIAADAALVAFVAVLLIAILSAVSLVLDIGAGRR